MVVGMLGSGTEGTQPLFLENVWGCVLVGDGVRRRERSECGLISRGPDTVPCMAVSSIDLDVLGA